VAVSAATCTLVAAHVAHSIEPLFLGISYQWFYWWSNFVSVLMELLWRSNNVW